VQKIILIANKIVDSKVTYTRTILETNIHAICDSAKQQKQHENKPSLLPSDQQTI